LRYLSFFEGKKADVLNHPPLYCGVTNMPDVSHRHVSSTPEPTTYDTINNTLSIFKCVAHIFSNTGGDFRMIEDAKIIDKVCSLRQQGMSVVRIAHTIARDNPNYFMKDRKEKNVSSTDILKIIEGLKREGRLPTTLLDSLKSKIGAKGRANPRVCPMARDSKIKQGVRYSEEPR